MFQSSDHYTETQKSRPELRGTVETLMLQLSILFTYPTSISPWIAQRGSDNRGSTVLTNMVYLTKQIMYIQQQN